MLTNLLSNVLQVECVLPGLCGGRLWCPYSMLRDMREFRSDTWLSLALITEVVIAGLSEFGWLEPGVLDADLWLRGDDGADPTVLWD